MPMKPSTSIHEVRFFLAVRAETQDWHTAKALGERAQIAHRTARAFAAQYTKLGLLEEAQVWPAYQYRWKPAGTAAVKQHLAELAQAARVFGVA